MKKGVSILMALMLILAGLHLSVSSHFCCGKLATVKLTFTGEKAGCGMEDEADSDFPSPSGKSFKVH